MIAIVGSTGNTGAALARLLHTRGVPFRALSRDPARARAALGEGVEIVGVPRPEDLVAGLRGAERVYAALGGTPQLLEVERAVIDAARAAGVRHLVKLSGVEVDPAPAQIQRIHAAAEAHLVASGLDWTILGANFFFQNLLAFAGAVRQGVLPMPTGAGRAAMVDVEDIAAVAAAALTEPGHEGRRYRVNGPEALDHAEVAAILARVTGREVRFLDLPGPAWEASLVGAGLPDWLAAQLTDIYTRFFGQPGAAALSPDVERVLGRPGRTLAAWAEANAAAFR